MGGKRRHRALHLVDSMRSHLSAHAASVLEDLNIQRDPEWMTDTETLRATLGERGLVAHDSALEIEEMAGGAELWPGKHLGIFASLRETHGQDQPQRRLSKAIVRTEKKRAEAAAANPAVQRDAPRHAPLMLVHIRPWNDLSMPTVIVNQRGTLLFEDPDDDLDVREPAFDSFVQFIETFALLQEAMYLEPRTEPTRRHWLWTDERIGDELARALDLEPFPPARVRSAQLGQTALSTSSSRGFLIFRWVRRLGRPISTRPRACSPRSCRAPCTSIGGVPCRGPSRRCLSQFPDGSSDPGSRTRATAGAIPGATAPSTP